MKKGLKRIVAMLCAAAMIAGGCFVAEGNTTKANDATVEKEWTLASQVGDITSTKVEKIYYENTNLDIQLNAEKTKDDYMLYIKVYLQGETAVDCMGGNTEKSIDGAYVELANRGDADGELCWIPANWKANGIELQTGVNEIYLPLNKFVDANAADKEAFSVLETITHFRIYTNAQVSDCTGVILNEVKIIDVSPVVQEYTGAEAKVAPKVAPTENVPDAYVFAGWYTDEACKSVLLEETTGTAYAKFVKEEVLSLKTQYAIHKGPGVIDNCDDRTAEGRYDASFMYTKQTNTAGEYKEGTGAFYLDIANSERTKFKLKNPVDISDYSDGYLHLSFYIDDPTKLNTALVVDFGTDENTFNTWQIPNTQLAVGWNELYLDLSTATVNLESMAYFRIRHYTGTSQQVMLTRVDDIRVVKKMPDRAIIDNCDTVTGKYVTNGLAAKLTTTAGEYKEGKGAFYNQTQSNIMMYFTLSNPVDISNYSDGYLHLSVYVDNPNNIKTGLIVDLGNDDSTLYTWIISSTSLSVGWNELYLDIASKITGNVDLKSIDYLRIRQYSGATETVLVRIDDIYVEEDTSKVIPEDYADLRFVTTVDSINYANVGFEITIGEKTREMYSNQVYGTLHGVSGDETITYKPDVFTIESEYFKAHTLTNIPDTAFDTPISVRPFWTTQDGTKVFGTEKTCTINGEIEANENATPETDLRVVFSSDIHYTEHVPSAPENIYHGIDDPDTRLQYWVDCIKEEHERDNIDLLILNGDLSLDYWVPVDVTETWDESGMTQKFIDTYLQQIKDLGIEVFVIPGNHELYSDEQWKTMTGNYRQGYMTVGNNLFICLDNYNNDENLATEFNSDGVYTNTDTEYVQELMQQYSDHDVYLIAHYFYIYDSNTGEWVDEPLRQLLLRDTEKRIKGLIDGHSHEARVRNLGEEWNNILDVKTGNFSWTFEGLDEHTRFWGFRELIITEDNAYSQYINVESATGCNVEGGHKRTTSDAVWFY